MSLFDMDALPRLADTHRAEDLSTEGCMALVSQIMRDAAEEYQQARRALRADPADKDAAEHMATCRAFYLSDYFKLLSCGVADGRIVMHELDRQV